MPTPGQIRANDPLAFGPGGGGGQVGGIFQNMFSGAPNANISPAKVPLPSPSDFGTPATAPSIADPNRSDYGLSPEERQASLHNIQVAGADVRSAEWGFNNPTKTGAFASLMNLAQQQTGQAAAEQSRKAADAAQRRGFAGGFEDTARSAAIDRMNALATAGFAGADQIRQEEGAHYGAAIGAFTQMQDSFNQAEAAGNTAFAHDLLSAHVSNAENQLKAMDLNAQERAHYGDALNQARELQAQLDEQFNKDKIDNARYIQGQAQIASQLQATMLTLGEKAREFNISTAEQQQEFKEKQREFDIGTAASPGTALRALPGQQFRGMLA